jgi:hypothetical protein
MYLSIAFIISSLHLLTLCNCPLNLSLPLPTLRVAPLLCPSVGVKPNTWKSWVLESSGTPECSELGNKGQNTSHWGVLGVVGKVLKCKDRKWPCIGNLDICSPSYGQKKGRESNWQFDSRPLKVENRHLPDVRFGSAIWCWKDRDEGYNFGSDLIAIQLYSRELWWFKVPEVLPRQIRDSISGVSGICAIWMPPPWRAAENTIGSKVVAYSRVRAVVSFVCPRARGKSQHQKVSWMLN